jgi:protein transport protein SEC31
MVDIFSNDMQRVASKAPASFAQQVKDTQKRLNILFDHLNNEELVKPDTIERLSELAEALQSKDYDVATRLQVDIQREKTDECGNWMVSRFIPYQPQDANDLLGRCKKTGEHEQSYSLDRAGNLQEMMERRLERCMGVTIKSICKNNGGVC